MWQRLGVGFIFAVISGIMWLNGTRTTPRTGSNQSQPINLASGVGVALRSFLENGGLSHIFPGDTSRDTAVQFELMSEVTGVTSVGRPISVTVRNAPSARMPYR
eukprot:TRINITY_DN2224_c0_g1_i1.p1 TRINITY_DN2224_c0_g1~~TRINITY_DN2224_c0_g1_i1.p1  ORF type:complete len:104 (-),score=15.40 TRINITY_DN2224_c0_g1_i1:184-495(-)